MGANVTLPGSVFHGTQHSCGSLWRKLVGSLIVTTCVLVTNKYPLILFMTCDQVDYPGLSDTIKLSISTQDHGINIHVLLLINSGSSVFPNYVYKLL